MLTGLTTRTGSDRLCLTHLVIALSLSGPVVHGREHKVLAEHANGAIGGGAGPRSGKYGARGAAGRTERPSGGAQEGQMKY